MRRNIVKILLLEDDNYLNEEIKFQIEYEGHLCDVMNNADLLLQNIKILEQYKLVVLDLMMLRGKFLENDKSNFATGELIFRKIKESFPNLKIIILTAMKESDFNLSKDELKDVPIFIKPICSQELRKFINLINICANL